MLGIIIKRSLICNYSKIVIFTIYLFLHLYLILTLCTYWLILSKLKELITQKVNDIQYIPLCFLECLLWCGLLKNRKRWVIATIISNYYNHHYYDKWKTLLVGKVGLIIIHSVVLLGLPRNFLLVPMFVLFTKSYPIIHFLYLY